MLKNKSYIGISFIILIFGIYAVPKIIDRIKNNDIVKGDRLDAVSNHGSIDKSLMLIGPAPKFELTDQNKKNNWSYNRPSQARFFSFHVHESPNNVISFEYG
jgi:hypothetical protein